MVANLPGPFRSQFRVGHNHTLKDDLSRLRKVWRTGHGADWETGAYSPPTNMMYMAAVGAVRADGHKPPGPTSSGPPRYRWRLRSEPSRFGMLAARRDVCLARPGRLPSPAQHHRVREETRFLSRSRRFENQSVWFRYVSTSRS